MNNKTGQRTYQSRNVRLRIILFIVGIIFSIALNTPADETLPWAASGAAAEPEEPVSQPYGVETEWGDVLGPDGTVKKKTRVDAPPKNVPQPTPKLKRARPGEIQGVPGGASDVEDMHQLQEPTRSAPTSITEPEPEKKPEPKPEKAKPEKKPKPEPRPEPAEEASQPVPPVKPLPKIKLANTSSFTLNATEIIYDPESKTLRASYAVYEDNAYTITADEIRMDLSRTLLAAQGSVLVSVDDNSDHHFIGDFALMNYRTKEGELRFGKDISWFSMSYSGSFDVDPDDLYVSSNSQPLPAAGAPSLGGAVDVVFAPRREKDTVRARYMTASAGSGLTFYCLTYNDTRGRPARLPIFTMTNGDWREDNFQLRNLTYYQVPGNDNKLLRLQSQYFFADNPHGKGSFSSMDEIYWAKNGTVDKREHDFRYGVTKQYIRGDNVLDVYASRFDNYLTGLAQYNRYWFPGSTGLIRFGISSDVTDSEQEYDRHNNRSSLWLRRNSRDFLINLNANVSQSMYQDANPPTGYQDDSSSDASLILEKKPTSLFGGNALLDLYSYISWQKINHSSSNSNYDYISDYMNKTFGASLFGKPVSMIGGGDLKLRAAWEYLSYSSKSEFGTYHYYDSGNINRANASARFAWDVSGGELGAEYIASRSNGSGSGNWAAYFTLSPSPDWNVRVSSRYMNELSGDSAVDNTLGETADISYHINSKMNLLASFDLDNYFQGAMMHRLMLFADFSSGSLVFSVVKYTSASNGRYYYAPYQYSLAYYFSR